MPSHTAEDRRTRMSVLQFAEDPSGDGQPLGEWLEVQRVWARVRHSGGSEQLQAGGMVSSQAASLRVHTKAFGWSPALRLRDVATATLYRVDAVRPYSPEPGMTELQCQVLT